MDPAPWLGLTVYSNLKFCRTAKKNTCRTGIILSTSICRVVRVGKRNSAPLSGVSNTPSFTIKFSSAFSSPLVLLFAEFGKINLTVPFKSFFIPAKTQQLHPNYKPHGIHCFRRHALRCVSFSLYMLLLLKPRVSYFRLLNGKASISCSQCDKLGQFIRPLKYPPRPWISYVCLCLQVPKDLNVCKPSFRRSRNSRFPQFRVLMDIVSPSN